MYMQCMEDRQYQYATLKVMMHTVAPAWRSSLMNEELSTGVLTHVEVRVAVTTPKAPVVGSVVALARF